MREFLYGGKLAAFLLERRNYFKGKLIPLKGWTGPDFSRILRLPDFNTIGK
jgi:hypothetical protein